MAIESLRDIVRSSVSAFASGGASPFHVGSSAPADPEATPLWFDLDTGAFLVWVDDGTTATWIEVGGAGGGGWAGYIASETEPDPAEYPLWFNLAEGAFLVWVDDGTTSQWVEPGVTDIAAQIHAATNKATPVDADELGLSDSAASWALKKLTWSGAKAAIRSASEYAGLRNKLINSNFTVNQENVSGTVSLAAGAHGHDGWKAGASGCTYTFSKTENITTLTITAGSLIQVVLGDDFFTGTHVLSWGGTCQGKIGAGSYSASGVTASLTGGTNVNVEFNTGTLFLPQLEEGATPSLYSYDPDKDLERCFKRFYAESTTLASQVYSAHGGVLNATQARMYFRFPVEMLSSPTFSVGAGAASNFAIVAAGTAYNATAVTGQAVTTKTAAIDVGVASGLTAGDACIVRSNSTTVTRLQWSARP